MSSDKNRSAASRRDQERRQRQQRQAKGRSGNVRKYQKQRGPWLFIGGILVMIAVVIGIFYWMSMAREAELAQGNEAALQTLTKLDPSISTQVGDGSVTDPLKATSGEAIYKGSSNKPTILYVGAEYCPYCATERWAVINAMSRFGTFGSLKAIHSSEGNIPTYSFLGKQYTSDIIDFQTVETANNESQPAALEKLSPEQEAIFKKFDAAPYVEAQSAGSIPFISIGNQFVMTGASYNSNVLLNKSYAEIEQALKDPNSEVAHGVLGSANYLTAAVCLITDNKPENVCTAAPIPSLQAKLKALQAPTGTTTPTATATQTSTPTSTNTPASTPSPTPQANVAPFVSDRRPQVA